MASEAYSPRNYFLSNLDRWELSIPLQTQWVIKIIPDNPNVGTFLQQIGTDFTTIDYSTFKIGSDITSKLFDSHAQSTSDGLGLHFAQSISLPREGFSPAKVGISDSGGFLQGVVVGERMGQGDKILTTDFLETNLDFSDGIIRPWIISAAYTGLIQLYPGESIKSTIYISQYTRGRYAGERPLRKSHVFYGCVPYEVDGGKLDYAEERIITRSISWIYNHYTYNLSIN